MHIFLADDIDELAQKVQNLPDDFWNNFEDGKYDTCINQLNESGRDYIFPTQEKQIEFFVKLSQLLINQMNGKY